MSNTGFLSQLLLSSHFPLELSGRVFTSLNHLVIPGAFAAQAGWTRDRPIGNNI